MALLALIGIPLLVGLGFGAASARFGAEQRRELTQPPARDHLVP